MRILNQKKILWKAGDRHSPWVYVINKSTPDAMIRAAGEILSDDFRDDLSVLFENLIESREVLGMHYSEEKVYAKK